MIVVKYNRRETTMTISGHAMTADKGKDLVCAAASVLGFTLIACVADSEEKFLPVLTQKDGELRVACSPGRSFVTPCRRVMDTIFTGFEVLANEHPDNVRAQRED